MFYTGYTNEKTDNKFYKDYFKKSLLFHDIYELKTIYDSHVSFNRRAFVAEDWTYHRYVLISYNTIVCEWNPYDGFIRYWDGYSSTTMRHINEFRRQHGLQSINKKTWEDLPVKKWEE